MKSLIVLSLIFILLATISCSRNDNIFPVLEYPEKTDTIFEIKEWLVIGPFTFDTLLHKPDETFDIEENSIYGFNEKGISQRIYKKLLKSRYIPFYANRKNAVLNLFDYLNGTKEDKSNFYAYTTINCKDDKELVMLCDGSNSYAVWINGEKVQETKGRKDAYKIADKFVKVRLKKGKNLVFAKINRSNNIESWKLIVGFTSPDRAKKLFLTNYRNDFISNPISNKHLHIYTGPFNSGTVSIHKNEMRFDYPFGPADINDGILKIELPQSLPVGYYECSMKLDSTKLTSHFFAGGPEKYFEKILKNDFYNALDSNTIYDLRCNNPFLSWLNINAREELSAEKKGRQDLTLAEWGKNYLETFEYLEINGNLKNKPGLTIKSIRNDSSFDNSPFLFYVSKSLVESEKRYPLVIMVINDTIHKSLTESEFLNTINQIKIDSRLADEQGLAVCWLFMNGKDFNLSQGVNEISLVLKKLTLDYPTIDTNYVFLFGEANGGCRAMQLAQVQPHRYMGLALYNPFTCDESGRQKLLDLVGNLLNLHVLLLHGQKFEGSPFKSFGLFVKTEKTGD
jgi:hypothetical protein